jgi:hypothetical protein
MVVKDAAPSTKRLPQRRRARARSSGKNGGEMDPNDFSMCRNCGLRDGYGKHALFHSFAAPCHRCGVVWGLSGCSMHGHESGPPNDHETKMPLYAGGCLISSCRSHVDGIIPEGAIRTTIHVTLLTGASEEALARRQVEAGVVDALEARTDDLCFLIITPERDAERKAWLFDPKRPETGLGIPANMPHLLKDGRIEELVGPLRLDTRTPLRRATNEYVSQMLDGIASKQSRG